MKHIVCDSGPAHGETMAILHGTRAIFQDVTYEDTGRRTQDGREIWTVREIRIPALTAERPADKSANQAANR
jgi:hypothetical protein